MSSPPERAQPHSAGSSAGHLWADSRARCSSACSCGFPASLRPAPVSPALHLGAARPAARLPRSGRSTGSLGLLLATATATPRRSASTGTCDDTRARRRGGRASARSARPAHFARAWCSAGARARSGWSWPGGAFGRRSAIASRSAPPAAAASASVPFGLSRGVHGLVLGATGSGKTVTQAAIAQAYILAGLPAIVIDPKGDRYLRAVLARRRRAKRGSPSASGRPTGTAVYNPFGRGGPTEIADKALAGHRWSEPHYELGTQRLLRHVLTTMRAAGQWPPTLSSLVTPHGPRAPRRPRPRRSAARSPSGSAPTSTGSRARAQADLGGGRDRLAVLAEGELGPRLDPALRRGRRC